jgi:hypothetical protein
MTYTSPFPGGKMVDLPQGVKGMFSFIAIEEERV